MQDPIEMYMAQNAAMKAIIEVVLRAKLVTPHQLGETLKEQSKAFERGGHHDAALVLETLSEFAQDEGRSAVRRLLDEPPHGSA